MTTLFRCFALVTATAMALFSWNGAKAETTNYVSDLSGNDAWDGLTWETAKKSIQGAIDAASPGNTVLVTNGTYVLTSQILITNGITLRSTSGTNFTTVDGNYATGCFSISNSQSVVEGFTIMRGSNTMGGGLWMSAGTIQGCVISSNTAYQGGGVFLSYGGVVSNCTIRENLASSPDYGTGGGGIWCESGGIVRNCMIINNVADPVYNGRGGGMRFYNGGYLEGSTVMGNTGTGWGSSALRFDYGGVATNCIITHNVAIDDGGVIRFSGGGALYDCTIISNSGPARAVFFDNSGAGTAVNCRIIGNIGGDGPSGCSFMKDCTIAQNQATNGGGGGLSLDDGWLAIGCTIVSNSASDFGGGVQLENGSTLIGCTIAANTSGQGGGGVNCNGGVLSNCFIIGNNAAFMGGLNLNGGTMDFCTISGNVATNGPGGLDASGSGGIIRNCIISNNTAGGDSGFGGGLGMNSGNLLISSIVCSNTATQGGGGINCNGSAISNCIIAGNTAKSGGGVNLNGGTVDHCAISGNMATNGSGGGMFIYQVGTIQGCLLSGNTASNGHGGGVYGHQGGEIRNCLIVSNSVAANDCGGGVGFYQGGKIENCTVVRNHAGWDGGGVFLNNGGVAQNCIIRENTTDNTGRDAASYMDGWSYSYCCLYPLVSGPENYDTDPFFVNPDGGDFGLATNSPCIDTGIIETWMSSVTDLEGKPRIIHDAVDMGAFEAILPSWDTDGDTIPDLWTWEHFGHLTGLAADLSRATDSADGTGRDNLYKYAADLDPTNPLSYFQIAAISNLPPNRFVRFQSSSNRVYGLKWSTNLVSDSWMDVSDQTNVWGTGTLMSLSDTNPATLRFYKVGVKAP